MLKASNVRVVAVMDPVGIEEIARQFKIEKAYKSERKLLADPEVQAVYIASPVHFHLKQIEMAAAAGKHILCEKPLGRTAGEARRAVQICQKYGVFLQEGYMMKFHGAHRKIKALIDEGKLGKVVYIRAQLSCWYPPIPGAWRQDPRKGGGGALIDMASHLIDLIQYFAGKIRRVAALVGRQVHSYRSEDSSTILLETAAGAHATIDCFYCIPDEASRTRLEVYGSAGAIYTEGTVGQSRGGKMEGIFGLGSAGYDAMQDKDVARKFQNIPFEKVDPYVEEVTYFADCVLRGQPPEINDGANAVNIARIVDAAYESYRRKAILPVG
jgi:predicted dehydrogenase